MGEHKEQGADHGSARRYRAGQVLSATLLAVTLAASAEAQGGQQAATQPSLTVYGFGMADAIVDFKQNNPDWYDTVRPSKLPSFEDEFGRDGRFYLSARQSRFGARATLPTNNGDVKATFEFDMFGVGRDAGLTTIRLRHAWGQWKHVGGGLTNSQFMDIDVFPNTLEYWGPNGMLFFRNVQVFWEFFNDGTSNARVSIEAPGASGDAGIYAERIELQSISPRFPMPDIAGHYRFGRDWGYIQAGGIVRYIAWDDLLPNDVFDLDGHVWGWGATVSSNVKPTANDVLRLQVNYGEGIQNYFNDAPIDVGVRRVFGNPRTPVDGEALPIWGLSAYLDHNWNSRWSTALGYARVDVDNSNGQAAEAFQKGQYASTNLLWAPVTNVLMGGEFLWADRENNFDGFSSDDYRLQFSFKYSFSHTIGG